MNSFNIGALAEWELIGGIIELPAAPGVVSQHRFLMLTTDAFEVYAADESMDASMLVAAGERGLSRIRFSSIGPVSIDIKGAGDAYIRRAYRVPQVLPESEVPSFTTLEPAGPRPGQDLRRMMMAVALNQQRREKMLNAELERLGRRLSAAESRAVPAAAPAASPAPTATPAETAGETAQS